MLKLTNNKTPDKVLLIAESNSDMEILHWLYDNSIAFGLWKVYDKDGDKSKTSSDYKFLSANFPLANGMAFINKVTNYVPKEK